MIFLNLHTPSCFILYILRLSKPYTRAPLLTEGRFNCSGKVLLDHSTLNTSSALSQQLTKHHLFEAYDSVKWGEHINLGLSYRTKINTNSPPYLDPSPVTALSDRLVLMYPGLMTDTCRPNLSTSARKQSKYACVACLEAASKTQQNIHVDVT